MKVWVQKHDFSSVDLDDGSMEASIEAMAAVDWADEGRLAEAAERDGRDCCPAGIGWVAEDGRILHLMPNGEGTMNISYIFPRRKKSFFGLVNSQGQGDLWLENIPCEGLQAILRDHYDGAHSAILEGLS